MKYLYLILFSYSLFGQSIDPNKYRMITDILTQSRHQSSEDLQEEILKIEPSPQWYLKKIIEEEGHRIYVKSFALEILGMVGKDSSSKDFLKNKIEDTRVHPSLRTSAYDGYIKGNSNPNSKTKLPEEERWARDPLFHNRQVNILPSDDRTRKQMPIEARDNRKDYLKNH